MFQISHDISDCNALHEDCYEDTLHENELATSQFLSLIILDWVL